MVADSLVAAASVNLQDFVTCLTITALPFPASTISE